LNYSDHIDCIYDNMSVVNASLIVTNCLMLCSTSDDPFMLYAALYFGQETFIVTNDELRDHRHVLGPELASRLELWQRQRQITFTANNFTRKFHFKVSTVLLNKYLFYTEYSKKIAA